MMNNPSCRRTLIACYLGYVSQAIVNNLGPLLFSTFQRQFNIGVGSLALLVVLNFGVQILTDLAAAHFVDRIGYRTAVIGAGFFCILGLAAMGVLPFVLHDPYTGLVIAVIINALSGGLMEVLISPIVEALPLKNKGANMSLLHSSYCFGFAAVVLLSTAYFSFAGTENWRWLPLLWTLPPLASLLFFIRAPLYPLVEDHSSVVPLRVLFTKRSFLILLVMMICAGASEQAMTQWASYFAEAGLGVSKALGDLLGPCAFAILMGLARMFFGTRKRELPLDRILIGSSALCIASYLITVFSPFPLLSLFGCALCGLAVAFMWPGIFSLSAKTFPLGGTALFAVLAMAGDIGCGLGPGLVGFVMKGTTLQAGLLAAMGFPLLMIAGLVLRRGRNKKAGATVPL
jgi:fucose permease